MNTTETIVEEKNASAKTKTLAYYDYETVLKTCLEYFADDDMASGVWIDKYAVKDLEGKIYEKTPSEMHRRMAREFARIENKYAVNLNGNFKKLSEYGQKRQSLNEDNIFEYFDRFKYIIPQGSVMTNLGNPFALSSLSNCVVLPQIYDSYAGITYADQQLAQLFKRRCGVGIDISTLRPENTAVKNASASSSGAVSFMERYSNTTREVAQNGRRGALMITIDINHPDVEKFITIKQDLTKVTGANISVKLSDEFMQAVKNDTEYILKFPINSPKPKVTKTIKARELWNLIINSARNTAEPGIIFWDTQHWYSTSSVYPEYQNISVNPCAEISMGADSCRLIALNLFGCVIDPFTSKAKFDYEKFYEVTYEAQRLMDDLVDLELECIERIIDKINSDPEPDYIKETELRTWKVLYESGKNGRRTGLGFTALADTIAALGIKFDSTESLKTVEKIMKTKCKAEFDSSIDMALERGKFTTFDPIIEDTSHFIQMLKKELPEVYDRMMLYGRRNISISTVAPNGSLSIVAQTSSGIEPVYMVSYKRRRKVNPNDKNAQVHFTDKMGDKWQEYDVFHPKFKMWSEVTKKKDVVESPYYKATAEEIDWLKRVELQAIVQKYTTHSISSTINLPEDVAVEKVAEIYLKAWEMGLKGITVYRASSRTGVLISKEEKKKDTAFTEVNAPKRPELLDCEVIRFQNDREKWIGFVGLLNNKPYEIFTGPLEEFPIPTYVEKGKIKRVKKNDKSAYNLIYSDRQGEEITVERLNRTFAKVYWNYAKLISGILRHGMPLPSVIETIDTLSLDSDVITTWKNGVVRMLKKYIKDGTPATDSKCPECSDEKGLRYENGCISCFSCGYSKCG